jgi:TRAP-type uncharacterized transport system fused permease subunit
VQLGVPLLHAHLFVFWYALLSTITPPVCGTVFIASGMVDAPWPKVARHAMSLGLGLYVIPLVMVAHPGLIQLARAPLTALATALATAAGLWFLSKAVIAPLGLARRTFYIALAAAAFWLPSLW